MDETALSNGELYTIVTNKAAKGRKASLVAIKRYSARRCYRGFKEDTKATSGHSSRGNTRYGRQYEAVRRRG